MSFAIRQLPVFRSRGVLRYKVVFFPEMVADFQWLAIFVKMFHHKYWTGPKYGFVLALL